MKNTTASSSRIRDWAALIALMLGYSVLFFAYYPPLAGIEDEIGFINQALVWSRGSISSEGAGYPDLADFGLQNGRHVALRHPGRSVVVLPFLMIGGVRSVFTSGLVLHLAMTLIGAGLLARIGRPPLWAVLLLLHPTLAIYSRTILADAAAGTGLLLAGLFLTVPGPLGAIGAGSAVGMAALMRYHAGLALAPVVLLIALDRDRPGRLRDSSLGMLAGSALGLAIVAYNLAVYGTILDPFTSKRGFFSSQFLVPHGLFYTAALMMIWPAMLLAPLFDRSRLRWLARSICGFYLTFAVFYYFHDRGRTWPETIIVGQRLIQVALPLWIISYANVVDNWSRAAARRLPGDWCRVALVTLACLGLLATDGLIFRKHQEHLNRLLAARDATIAAIPDGSLVVVSGPLRKLFGVPASVPSYRWHDLAFQGAVLVHPGDREIASERKPWYLAVASPGDDRSLLEAAHALIAHYSMREVPTRVPSLSIFRAPLPGLDRPEDLPSPRATADGGGSGGR